VQVGVRQQGEEARALHRNRQLALEVRLGAGDPGRDQLAVLVDEILQQIDILVVDVLDALGGEPAELAPAEERTGCALLLLVVLAASAATSHCHLGELQQK
jgi:hypothetical protein